MISANWLVPFERFGVPRPTNKTGASSPPTSSAPSFITEYFELFEVLLAFFSFESLFVKSCDFSMKSVSCLDLSFCTDAFVSSNSPPLFTMKRKHQNLTQCTRINCWCNSLAISSANFLLLKRLRFFSCGWDNKSAFGVVDCGRLVVKMFVENPESSFTY